MRNTFWLSLRCRYLEVNYFCLYDPILDFVTMLTIWILCLPWFFGFQIYYIILNSSLVKHVWVKYLFWLGESWSNPSVISYVCLLSYTFMSLYKVSESKWLLFPSLLLFFFSFIQNVSQLSSGLCIIVRGFASPSIFWKTTSDIYSPHYLSSHTNKILTLFPSIAIYFA